MKVASIQEMRALDAAVINDVGVPEEVLMENAGIAASRLLLSLKPDLSGCPLPTVVVCSPGNNGGDGFVVARQLHSLGGRVSVLLLGDAAKCRGAAKMNLAALAKIPAIPVITAKTTAVIRNALKCVPVIVDALLGTGLDRTVEGTFLEAIRAINSAKQRGALVLSLDIPSGVNGNTGEIMGEAVQATCTVTFGVPKLGALLFPGFLHCGEIYLSRISFPTEYSQAPALRAAINDYVPLPARSPQAHKKNTGTALFVAGSDCYLGAPYLAGASFLRSGGGYAMLASVPTVLPFVATKCPEIVLVPLAGKGGAPVLDDLPMILEAATLAGVVVVGPGISLAPETQALVLSLAERVRCPLVIDGDAISALANNPKSLKKRQGATIITPHTGEMARLSGVTATEVEARRVTIVTKLARDLAAYIVLKGPHSLIACPDGRLFINLTGNAGMATAGTGDVLTGIIAAMCGAGLTVEDALRKAVYLHGLAGDIAAAAKGERGMIASDVLESIPEALRCDQQLGKNTREIKII